jgi:hypothetical protein
VSARSTEKKPEARRAEAEHREPYSKPTLRSFGNVAVITAGGGAAGVDFGSEISAP